MKKLLSVFLAAVMLISYIGTFSSCASDNTNISVETEPRKIKLTEANFSHYFTYDISGGAFQTDKYAIIYPGEIVFSFYPLKNVEFQDCSITVTLEHNYSNRTTAIPDNYAPQTKKIPYDGRFTMTFDGVKFYSRIARPSAEDMKIRIEVSGLIIVK